MEQLGFEDLKNTPSEPDEAELLIFEAIDAMAENKNPSKQNEFIAAEIRRRAEGHDMDAIDLAQKFWKWRKGRKAA